MSRHPEQRRWWGRLAPLLLVGAACNAIVGIDDPIVVEPHECDRDADCPEGKRCLATPERRCVENAECDDEGDCPGVPICSNGQCRNDCSADPSSCLPDQYCDVDGACRGDDPSRDPVGSGGSAGNPSAGGRAGNPSASGGRSGAGSGSGGTRAGSSGSGSGGDAGAEGGAPPSAGGSGGGVSPDSGAGGEGGNLEPDCEDEGAVSCTGTASEDRVRCQGGELVAHDPCEEGELCDTASSSGVCRPILGACIGREPGEGFCEGASRKVCGPDFVTVETTECDSEVLCSVGTGGDCGACVANQYRCTDNVLEVCNTTRTGFEQVQDCEDVPCNAVAHACTEFACLTANEVQCNGDDLQRCNEDRNGFTTLDECDPGLCDEANEECDECVPTLVRCSSETERSRCNDDGQGETAMPCPGGEPYCTNGTCVECKQDDHCPVPNDCYDPHCNLGSGECAPDPKDVGTPCDGDGNGTNDGLCNASNQCVACLDAGDCGTPPACRVANCSAQGVCSFPAAGINTPCGTNDYCDGGGSCVDCNMASQCGTDSQCAHPTCQSNLCGISREAGGTACTTGGGHACDGNGNCVDCFGTGQAQCTSDKVCHSQTCVIAEHPVGNSTLDTGTQAVFANFVTVCPLPALAYDAVLVNFGVAGNVGGVAARMVLYAGSASAPSGAYIAQSSGANFSLQAGTIIYPTPELTNVALSAGQVYWVGIVTQVDTTLRRDSAGTQTACRQWGQSFSAAFGNAQAGNGLASTLNLFIQVRDTK